MQLTLTNLSAMLETFYEASVKTSKSVPPSLELKKLYFELLKDLDFETVNKNGFKHFEKNKWFPAACELRGDADTVAEIKAQEAWRTLEDAMEYYAPGFACSVEIINAKLDEWKRSDLKKYIRTWGREIVSRENITASRAQFLKAYKAEKENNVLQIEQSKTGDLPPRVAGMLEEIGGEKCIPQR